MSKKDVIEYYKTISKQREEMLQNLKDFEKECENGMIEPERIETIKENIQPLLRNYERISFIMFLLNQPNKLENKKKYNEKIKEKIEKLKPENSLESVIKENNEVINKTKNP